MAFKTVAYDTCEDFNYKSCDKRVACVDPALTVDGSGLLPVTITGANCRGYAPLFNKPTRLANPSYQYYLRYDDSLLVTDPATGNPVSVCGSIGELISECLASKL